ncbi:5'/3'-nucleotidase SurE [Amylibacter sp.]|jgi:5'-nucleotidase|nr:5'/3'-nucleotidase SurE [Amylibacter sp.]
MKILITNDDGIDAPGLAVLYKIALGLTSAEKILTVAPATEQSGVSHAISYHSSINLEKITKNRWACHGTPADCVIVGISEYNQKFDLVLSGVNRGNNAGQNTMYSGTVGATIEAAMNRIPAIALSQFFGPKLDNENIFDAVSMHGLKTIQNILSINIWNNNSAPIHYNVNFPPCLGIDVTGTSFTMQGYRTGAPFSTETSNELLKIKGLPQQQEDTGSGTDIHANINGKISITPCSVDLTNHAVLQELLKL